MNAKLCIAIFIIGCFASNITAKERTDTDWTVLTGPEKENGKPVEILEQTATSMTLSVDGRRGTARLRFTPKALPAVLSFEMQTIYNEQASEPPTQLFGTGDFRFFAGSAGNEPEDLGKYEGIQLRIFPHLDSSPSRRFTGEESHTATSLWIRNIDEERRINSEGQSHTGLMSDACQNRGREGDRHNCGWARVSLTNGGFAMRNGQSTQVSIAIHSDRTVIKTGQWHHEYTFKPSELRFDQIDTLAIAHTNISRGYQTIRISNVTVESP